MKYRNFKHFKILTSKQELIIFLNLSMLGKKKIQFYNKEKKKDYKK